MEKKTLYKFAEWFMERIDDAVREARIEGQNRGLTDGQVRQVLWLAFQSLGKQARISSAALNYRLKKRNKKKGDRPEDDPQL